MIIIMMMMMMIMMMMMMMVMMMMMMTPITLINLEQAMHIAINLILIQRSITNVTVNTNV